MSKKIEIVFTSDIENVAKKGEQKVVAGGYWRHYLFPRRLAVLAADKKARDLVKERVGAVQKEQEAHSVSVEAAGKAREETRVARQERKQDKKIKEVKKAATLKSTVKKGKES